MITNNRASFAQRQQGVGGGAATAPSVPAVRGGAPATPVAVAMDPSGLVPVNRAQPVANDGLEGQRLMERRMGSMPPSSFAGAGIANPLANRVTDTANAEMFTDTASAPQLSGEARAAISRQNLYAPEPVPPLEQRRVPDKRPMPPTVANTAAMQRERLRQAMLLRRQRGFLGGQR